MIQITYYGHACFEIVCNGKSMLFDPFIRGNELAKDVDISKIYPDYIFITHAHSDHTADAVEIAKQSNATIVGMFEVCSYLQNQGAPKIHPMNIGGSWVFEEIEIKMTPAIHSSSFQDGTYGGVAGGFTLKTKEHHIYYAGDTALFSDMSLIGKKHTLDLAILPIGGNFTMDYNDAMEAAKLLNVNKVIGVHYDTFGLIKINHDDAINAFKAEKIELNLMTIGSTIKL
jgi:hypothetical protein